MSEMRKSGQLASNSLDHSSQLCGLYLLESAVDPAQCTPHAVSSHSPPAVL